MVNLADFKAVQVASLNTGFFKDASKKGSRILLLRTPKNVYSSL